MVAWLRRLQGHRSSRARIRVLATAAVRGKKEEKPAMAEVVTRGMAVLPSEWVPRLHVVASHDWRSCVRTHFS
jgi:hypothetical protein